VLYDKVSESVCSYHHFKIGSILTAVSMMNPGYFMAPIDLINAYCSFLVLESFYF